MKKLVIAAAIVCAAAISHGAALDWSLIGITQGSSSVSAGAVAYFMDATTYTAFTAAAADQKATYCANNYKYTATVASGRTGLGVSATSGTYAAADTISGYIVVFDTASTTAPTYYANTGTATVTVPGFGNAKFNRTFADTAGWQKIGGEPEPTPEPTSALLMLLGVAGLALRRKQK